MTSVSILTQLTSKLSIRPPPNCLESFQSPNCVALRRHVNFPMQDLSTPKPKSRAPISCLKNSDASRNFAARRRTFSLEGKYFKFVQCAGAVVVAQLAEQSLPTPEVRGSNPVIGNSLY